MRVSDLYLQPAAPTDISSVFHSAHSIAKAGDLPEAKAFADANPDHAPLLEAAFTTHNPGLLSELQEHVPTAFASAPPLAHTGSGMITNVVKVPDPNDPTTLPGVTVTAPAPAQPPSFPSRPPAGAPPSPGGGGAAAPASPDGAPTPSQQKAIDRVKTELGIDLTTAIKQSPTLSAMVSNAVSTFDWHFAFDAGGSRCAYSATSVGGTIYIDQADKDKPNAIIQQLSHELSHTNHRVFDDPKHTTSEQYVNDYLTAEGYAAMANEAVRHEIIQAGGDNILMASGNTDVTNPLYEAEYQQIVKDPAKAMAAAVAAGNTYGAYETVPDGRTYRQVFLDNYHSGGGTR